MNNYRACSESTLTIFHDYAQNLIVVVVVAVVVVVFVVVVVVVVAVVAAVVDASLTQIQTRSK